MAKLKSSPETGDRVPKNPVFIKNLVQKLTANFMPMAMFVLSSIKGVRWLYDSFAITVQQFFGFGMQELSGTDTLLIFAIVARVVVRALEAIHNWRHWQHDWSDINRMVASCVKIAGGRFLRFCIRRGTCRVKRVLSGNEHLL